MSEDPRTMAIGSTVAFLFLVLLTLGFGKSCDAPESVFCAEASCEVTP